MDPSWRIDHIFLLVADEASARRALAEAGLMDGGGRLHPGQGTANRCCFFDDAYLEMLWIAAEDEAGAPPASSLRLPERARSLALGRVGIALRGPSPTPPFAHRLYRPPYLPPDRPIPIARASDDPKEPLLFRSPGDAPPSARLDDEQLMRSRGVAPVRRWRLILAAAPASPALAITQDLGLLDIVISAEAPALEIDAGPVFRLPLQQQSA